MGDIIQPLARDFETLGGGADTGTTGFLNADQRGGTGPNGKPSFTVEWAGDYLTRPGWGPGAVVTYAFRATAPFTMPDGTGGFSKFNAQQIAQAELALQSWADVANITFVRVGGTGYSDSAQILFGNYSTGASGAAAFANYPDTGSGGDAWFNSTLSYNINPQMLNYGRMTLVHEIGHALGLSHPGDYNAGEGDPTYTLSADHYEDSRQYTIMSYWSEGNTGADFHGKYAAAPLLDDISAIQGIYGANMSTRTGDTTYGFNSNAGRDFYSAPYAFSDVIFAVWDAGGYDTLDFSGYAMNQVIDLRQGAFSSVGGLTGNVAIALGTIIERAVGGSASDVMHAAANYVGGALPDLTKLQTQINTSFATAFSLDGAFDLATDPRITASETIPHATVTAISSGGVEYYAFTVTRAGATAVFDLDGTAYGFDAFFRLYNGVGTQLASNDDGRGPGWTDSRLTYVFSTPGTYYISIDRFGGGGVPSGAPYTLHVSLEGIATPPRTLVGSTLEGRDGDDTLTGDLAADVLDGGAGDDVLLGGGGDDLLIGGDGDDRLDGEDGFDTASYAGAVAAVTVDLRITTAQATGGAGTDTLVRIEGLTGSAFADKLTGDAGANTLMGGDGDDQLEGGAGADVLNGGDGFDEARYLTATAAVSINLTTGVHTGDAAGDTFILIERYVLSRFGDQFTGSAEADDVAGGSGNDILSGAAGDDVLDGGSGNDILRGGLGADRLIGGDGTDQANYQLATSAVSLNLTTGVHTGEAAGDTFSSIERFVLTGYGDQFTGSAGVDEAVGYYGNDILFGAAGDDKLDGGNGNDILRGGEGADQLIGGTGTDTASYQIATAAVTLNLTTGVHTGEAAGDTFDSIERYALSTLDDSFIGSAGADWVDGWKGADVLYGQGGADQMFGNEGNDQLYGGTGNDVLHGDGGIDILYGDAGADILYGGTGADQLFGGDDNDFLWGEAGNDVLTGGAGADRFAFSYGSGVDIITDFQRGQDKIILKGMVGIDDFSDLRISADVHGWAVITWGDGSSTVTLNGVAAGQVTASDVWFT